MRRLNKIIIFSLLLTFAIINVFSFKNTDVLAKENGESTVSGIKTKENSTTGYVSGVSDAAGLFRDSDIDSLLEEGLSITEHGDMYVITVQENTNPYGDSESATEEYCDYFYNNMTDKKGNCVIFSIDMHTGYVYVYSKGSAIEDNLTSSKCRTITDNVYDYAADGDFYKCAYEAVDQIHRVLENMHIAQTMMVLSNIFIAAVSGFVIMYMVALSKSKASKPSDDEMLKYAMVRFDAQNPKDIVTGTTKTYCPRSSGSSSGGGHRSGGGGHSFGGGHSGGGHRFR